MKNALLSMLACGLVFVACGSKDGSCGDGDGDGVGNPPAVASCDNRVLDENETDLDCGGDCPPCNEGAMCLEGADCESGSCGDEATALAGAAGVNQGASGPDSSGPVCLALN